MSYLPELAPQPIERGEDAEDCCLNDGKIVVRRKMMM
jgi:hypothetical protein